VTKVSGRLPLPITIDNILLLTKFRRPNLLIQDHHEILSILDELEERPNLLIQDHQKILSILDELQKRFPRQTNCLRSATG
jgi:hypothetical protein